jgi:hypothetical protein
LGDHDGERVGDQEPADQQGGAGQDEQHHLDVLQLRLRRGRRCFGGVAALADLEGVAELGGQPVPQRRGADVVGGGDRDL